MVVETSEYVWLSFEIYRSTKEACKKKASEGRVPSSAILNQVKMLAPKRNLLVARHYNPNFSDLPVQSQYNFTLGGIVRQNSIFVPLPIHRNNISDIEKQMGRSTKPILPTTVIKPMDSDSEKIKRKRRKKKTQKGGSKASGQEVLPNTLEEKNSARKKSKLGYSCSPTNDEDSNESEVSEEDEFEKNILTTATKCGRTQHGEGPSPKTHQSEKKEMKRKHETKEKPPKKAKETKKKQSGNESQKKDIKNKSGEEENLSKKSRSNNTPSIQKEAEAMETSEDEQEDLNNENGDSHEDEDTEFDEEESEDELDDLEETTESENEDQLTFEQGEKEKDEQNEPNSEDETPEIYKQARDAKLKTKKNPAVQRGEGKKDSEAEDMAFDLFSHPLKVHTKTFSKFPNY